MKLLPELVTRNWTLKLTALVLAILLWMVTKAETPTRVPVQNVPVVVDLHDPGWTLAAAPIPATVTVVFSGPWRELVNLAGERPRMVIPVDEVADSVEIRQLRAGWVRLAGNLERTRIQDVQPSTVRLSFQRLETRAVPVAPRVRGRLPGGLELFAPITVEPESVRVSGPADRIERLDSVRLAPLDLAVITGPVAIELPIDTAGLAGLGISPTRVEVIVPAGPALLDTAVLGRPHPGPAAASPDSVGRR